MSRVFPHRALAALIATTATCLALLAGGPLVSANAAVAATGQYAVVTQDCASGGRLQARLVNNTGSATTFTLNWPGTGTWTANVAANDSTHFYFTKPDGTAYTLTTTTPQGLNTTASGTMNCSNALHALVSLDCSRNADGSAATAHRLRMTLDNRSSVSKTFTVNWAGRSGSPWTVTVPARTANDSLFWTLNNGTAYAFTVTSGSWSRTESGAATCGLGGGTPGMNVQPIFTTTTPISGVNQRNADGTYSTVTRTAASVRIPALAVTNAGTILAVADARLDSSADVGGGNNNIQTMLARSTDSGASFSAPRIIAHAPTTSEGYGDPSLLVNRVTGRIFCFFVYSPKPGISYWNSPGGDTSATNTTNLHIRYVYSDNDGVSWSNAIDLNPAVRNPAWNGMFASSGHGIQLAGGRLVQPIVYNDASGDHAANIYSDDNGATWRAGTSAAVGVNESKVIQRGTGKVVQNMRSNSGGNRWYATASDSGAANVASGFGAAFNTGLLDPGNNGDELSYLRPSDRDSSGRPLLTNVALLSNTAASSRNDLTVRVSRNDGESWAKEVVLKAGLGGYSTMAVLNNGTVGNLYEVGDTGGIYFANFTLGWVEGA